MAYNSESAYENNNSHVDDCDYVMDENGLFFESNSKRKNIINEKEVNKALKSNNGKKVLVKERNEETVVPFDSSLTNERSDSLNNNEMVNSPQSDNVPNNNSFISSNDSNEIVENHENNVSNDNNTSTENEIEINSRTGSEGDPNIITQSPAEVENRPKTNIIRRRGRKVLLEEQNINSSPELDSNFQRKEEPITVSDNTGGNIIYDNNNFTSNSSNDETISSVVNSLGSAIVNRSQPINITIPPYLIDNYNKLLNQRSIGNFYYPSYLLSIINNIDNDLRNKILEEYRKLFYDSEGRSNIPSPEELNDFKNIILNSIKSSIINANEVEQNNRRDNSERNNIIENTYDNNNSNIHNNNYDEIDDNGENNASNDNNSINENVNENEVSNESAIDSNYNKFCEEYIEKNHLNNEIINNYVVKHLYQESNGSVYIPTSPDYSQEEMEERKSINCIPPQPQYFDPQCKELGYKCFYDIEHPHPYRNPFEMLVFVKEFKRKKLRNGKYTCKDLSNGRIICLLCAILHHKEIEIIDQLQDWDVIDIYGDSTRRCSSCGKNKKEMHYNQLEHHQYCTYCLSRRAYTNHIKIMT